MAQLVFECHRQKCIEQLAHLIHGTCILFILFVKLYLQHFMRYSENFFGSPICSLFHK